MRARVTPPRAPIKHRVYRTTETRCHDHTLHLRKTIIHAVDKAAIIDDELKGLAEVADTLFPKNAP